MVKNNIVCRAPNYKRNKNSKNRYIANNKLEKQKASNIQSRRKFSSETIK